MPLLVVGQYVSSADGAVVLESEDALVPGDRLALPTGGGNEGRDHHRACHGTWPMRSALRRANSASSISPRSRRSASLCRRSTTWPSSDAGLLGSSAAADCRSRRNTEAVSYTHLRAHETDSYLVCRLLLEKKKYIYSIHKVFV